MSDLKTLKDLECMGRTHNFRPRWINEDELKAEAIKWINEDIKLFGGRPNPLIDRWIEFFNITEEVF